MRHDGKIAPLIFGALSLGVSGAYAEETTFRTRVHNAAYSVTTTEDVQAEIRFGQSVSARVLGRLTLVKNEKLTRYITLVGKSLAATSSRPEIDFHFAIVESDEVNAYSAPGGYIFITTATLKTMQDESELAAVLAHEIAHISERHIVKALHIKAADNEQNSLTKILSGSTDTAKVAFFQTVDKAVTMLFETGYSHNDEQEADRVGTLLLAATGYDPYALERFLTRIQGLAGDTPIKAGTTHPPTKARSTAMLNLLKLEGIAQSSLPRLPERFRSNVSIK